MKISNPAASLLVLLPLLTLAMLLVTITLPMTIVLGQEEQDGEEQQWLTYEDPILGITIQYPANWQVTEEESKVIFERPPVSSELATFVEVIIEPQPPEVNTSEKLMRQEMSKQRGLDLDIIKINQTAGFAGSSGNSSAYRVDYTTVEGILRSIDIFIVDKEVGYDIGFVTSNVDYSKYEPIFQKMIDSLRIIR